MTKFSTTHNLVLAVAVFIKNTIKTLGIRKHGKSYWTKIFAAYVHNNRGFIKIFLSENLCFKWQLSVLANAMPQFTGLFMYMYVNIHNLHPENLFLSYNFIKREYKGED